ncbi:hypothetical protein TTHERM_01186260 (macronuclear) [Tetrahymena thermophila SB210]|uniref:Uncharacterized protein n=1 Tax=Tetrahymena thermophila (strain SB210) TaxID=312017 RepID=Q23RR1_TETTS|nr:hypothetical protein TTHERM_01186260 [Tetrahymena thermophila SB210]EAR99224.2 hypothetical protein TTHERM_01186260 [Tetrahymena thermophila SB210]|eukprot:XP_001019469.2 hypothetical protein TTHERM_01186260 [Tetrahymena thermophila SB210]
MSHFNIESFNPYESCQCYANLDMDQPQKLCDYCLQKKHQEDYQFLAPKSYQEYCFEYNNRFQDESNQMHDMFNSQQHSQFQLSNQDVNPFHSCSNQLEMPLSTQFDQQNFIQDKAINPNQNDQFNIKQCEKEQNSQNNLNCFSTQFPDTQINLKSCPTSPYSSSSSSKIATSKQISSLSPQLSQQNIKSSSQMKSNYQSVIKNNIRDFLTPIVRMKTGFVDYELLEKENLSSYQYQDFLKQHFCVAGRRSLKIRQSTFDSLFDCKEKTQLKEKKSQLEEHQFKLQFDWINNINDTLICFLNSISI